MNVNKKHVAGWTIAGVAIGIAYGWYSGEILQWAVIGFFIGLIVALFGKKPDPK